MVWGAETRDVIEISLSVDGTDDAEDAGDDLELTLTVQNAGADPVELSFSDGQRVDFAAFDGAEEVWRWSADRMFTQALGTEELAPGESRTFAGTWADPPAGEYRVVGELVAKNADASAETTVTV